MRIIRYFFLLLFFVLSAESNATKAVDDSLAVDSVLVDSMNIANHILINKYVDSLSLYHNVANPLSAKSNGLIKSNSVLSRLFVPVTFFHSSIGSKISINDDDAVKSHMDNAVDDVLLSLYLNRPDLVRLTETQLEKAGTIRKGEKPAEEKKIVMADKVAPKPNAPQSEAPTGIVITKPNFWKFSANSKFQLLQYYYSDNWHKGGESNYSMFGELTLKANYNNKQKVKFDNELVMQLGFRNSREDTLHKFKTSTDVIRYTGKLGLQATKKWYYSVELIASTQFTKGLKNNDSYVYSDFMSPFNLNFGVGMDYSVATKNNKLTGSVNISALAFNFKYVDRKDLAGRHGIKGNHRTAEDFGSKVNANLTWKISDLVSWKTRLYAYTSFKRALVEWENTFKLQVSKYISANLVVYPRFDDSVVKDADLGYLQFNEYSSIGFEYSF